jgi:hypothetical protein
MPRVTRAQLRAQEAEDSPQYIHEDTEATLTVAKEDYDPFSTEGSIRPPLGEIQNNSGPVPQPALIEELSQTRQIKGSKKGKANKKNKLSLSLMNDENFLPNAEQEVLEDESQSDASSAAEVAAAELRKDEPVPETFQVPIDAARSRTPPSAAAREASRSLSRSPEKRLIAVQGSAVKTPRFDPVVHGEIPSAGQLTEEREKDSFIGSIKTRTPAGSFKSKDFAGDGPDSFVEDIISRSPSKYVPRIEDSVEAMDALEEAIEQVAEELPKAMAESLESPVKTRASQTPTARQTPKQLASGSAVSAKQTSKLLISDVRSASTTKPSIASKKVPREPAPRVSSARPQLRPSMSTTNKSRSSTQPIASGATAKPLAPNTTAHRRATSTNLSTSKPGFVPTKSTKPPTKSNFRLPGEAISAKMKAQREEQLKKGEVEAEAAKKRTEFKARPIPKIVAAGAGKERISSVLPRETATSKARMSLIAAKKDENGKPGTDLAAKKIVAESRTRSTRAGLGVRKSIVPSMNQTGLAITKTRPAADTAAAAKRASKTIVPANSSAVRTNAKTLSAPSKARQPNLHTTAIASEVRAGSDGSTTRKAVSITAPTTTAGTLKGKEVFSRGKMAEEEVLKQKREKEEAAKKARAEAAERGRLASREWAEKQRKRKTMMMAEKAKGDEMKADVAGTVCAVGC